MLKMGKELLAIFPSPLVGEGAERTLVSEAGEGD
jgi:hypothetical protein